MKILRTIGILAIVAALVLGGTASAFAKGPPDPHPGGGKHSLGKSGLFGMVNSVDPDGDVRRQCQLVGDPCLRVKRIGEVLLQRELRQTRRRLAVAFFRCDSHEVQNIDDAVLVYVLRVKLYYLSLSGAQLNSNVVPLRVSHQDLMKSE